MEQRISLITLGVADIPRARRFYEQLGWRGQEVDETVFFHRPTGSLIGADIVISACARDHWSWRWAARLTGCYERVRMPPDVRAKTTPNDAAARSIDRMAALPLKRLLVAHSDAIEDRPSEKLLDAWRFVRAG